jgi:hypothetical protein
MLKAKFKCDEKLQILSGTGARNGSEKVGIVSGYASIGDAVILHGYHRCSMHLILRNALTDQSWKNPFHTTPEMRP